MCLKCESLLDIADVCGSGLQFNKKLSPTKFVAIIL